MEPVSLIIWWVVSSLAAGAAIVVIYLRWSTVSNWVALNSLRNGYANVIATRLASGKYKVVAGVFNSYGTQVRSQTWQAGQVDGTLSGQLGQVIRVET
ncbi:hypothetical protein ABT297_34200 [Dactylosporangium sp. NPDC000555]|uniref:hypothetical protein n=1 Tax=Dactylosporangium sp. NPDC000555 TaxID=3154260 RepID=UPI00331AB96D